MTDKNKFETQSFFVDLEEETIAYQRLIKELNQEPDKVWVDAINPTSTKGQIAGSSSPWMIEDNSDALSEYIDDVSDFIDPEDINNFDW